MFKTDTRSLDVLIILAGFVIASGAAACAYALLEREARLFPLAFPFVLVSALILGLAPYLMIRAARKDTWVVACLVGFVVGSAPMAIMAALAAASHPSALSILFDADNLRGIAFFGLLGAGSALLFWFIVPSANQTRELPSPRPSRRAALLSVAAMGVVAAFFIVPEATRDRSCHNLFRDGRTSSFSAVGGFDLMVDIDQWHDVEREMVALRDSGDWSFYGKVRTDDGFPWLQFSLCREPGTNIVVNGLPEQRRISFSVFQPQGGTDWEPAFRTLYERVRARWPNNIEFTNKQGGKMDAPPPGCMLPNRNAVPETIVSLPDWPSSIATLRVHLSRLVSARRYTLRVFRRSWRESMPTTRLVARSTIGMRPLPVVMIISAISPLRLSG